jgi:predicted PurR-regulated permease PerM
VERLREKLDLRLALTIAAGISGGLIIYRLFMWTHEWWEELGSTNRSNVSGVVLILAIVAGLFFGVRWTLRRFKPRRWVIAASLLGVAVLFICIVGIHERLAVANQGNLYLDSLQPIK